MQLKGIGTQEDSRQSGPSHPSGWRESPPTGLRSGCIAISFIAAPFLLLALILVLVAGVVTINTRTPPRTYPILADIAPRSSAPVYTHSCCRSLYSGAYRFDVFYGTPDPFSATYAHYRQELAARGFQLETDRAPGGRPTDNWVRPREGRAPPECVHVAEFSGREDGIINRQDEIARLRSYPHAYVVTLVLGYC
ncbi:MAG: hypothetical protein KGK07_12715 [Chloroflexota bacterium]|nr:hypothetical protein [Chloroflexota bacterium]